MSRTTPARNQQSDRGGPYVGGLTRIVWQWVREQIYAGVVAAGYDDLNPAHVAVFRYPTPEGLRPTELADQLQITKQSVNDLLGHLEHLGYMTRESDPSDARARIVRLTAKGHKLEKTVYDVAKGVEERVGEMLGPRRFEQLRSALVDLVALIGSDGPPSRSHR